MMPFKSGGPGETFQIVKNTKDIVEICINKTINPSGLWRAHNPLISALPVFAIKLISVILVTRIVHLIFKPLHQPRIVAEILGGLILHPILVGSFFTYPLPISNIIHDETVANWALVYHMFLLGLELDVKPIKRVTRKALNIALSGILFSIFVGWVLHRYVLLKDFAQETKGKSTKNGPFFWGIALATTNFPDLARILAKFKLLYSDIGGLSLSASVISDLVSWIILLFGIAVLNDEPLFTVGSTLAFIGLCSFVVRPGLVRIINRETTRENRNYNELTSYVLIGVVLFGLITDACGSHSIIGPFVLGVIMPKGEFSDMLIKNLGNFVPEILMPIFFLFNGMRIDIPYILNQHNAATEDKYGTNITRVAVVFIAIFAAKIVSTFVAGLVNNLSPRDSLTLGVVMNTKGLLTIIILNSARDEKALNRQTFAIMMVASWLLTFSVAPFLALVYKSSARPFVQYKQRNIRSVGPNTQLRILACTHTPRNVSSMINLIECSNPTKQSPIHVLNVNLVELTGNTSAMLVVHDACKSSTDKDDANLVDGSSSPSNAFKIYGTKTENVTVHTLTAVSAYATMHEDICNLAEENQITLIIIPFHKQSTLLDEGLTQDSNNPHLKSLNNNLISNAQCSVGVFVDRGLSTSNYSNSRHHFAMLFIGGVDDREALAYAWRMTGHSKVSLTVIQFHIPSKEEGRLSSPPDKVDGILEAMTNTGRQKKLDDFYIDDFRTRSMNDASIEFLEKLVTSWEQILTLINSIQGDYDMLIVGRRHGSKLGLTTMLPDYSNFDELGVLGDALVSSTFINATTSILIVQQGGNSNDQ